jgi:hypothetical protein
VEKHKDRIELFPLPAYSPDLNPDEYLNQDYKQSANRNKVPANKKQLEANTILPTWNLYETTLKRSKGSFRQNRYAMPLDMNSVFLERNKLQTFSSPLRFTPSPP